MTGEQFQALLPLKSVELTGTLNGCIVKLDVQMTYVNTSAESAIECTFEFPLALGTIVERLVAVIGDKVVEASIREKEEAKEKYDDAIAGGHAAVIAEKKKDAIAIKIGNLLPGETATINFAMLEQLEIVGSAWAYTLPMSFFPDYSRHNFDAAEKINHFPYDFAYKFTICAGNKITYISAPTGATTSLNEDKTEAIVAGSEIGRSFRLFYRALGMQVPRLLYEENPKYPDEVAVMTSFVPTFEPALP